MSIETSTCPLQFASCCAFGRRTRCTCAAAPSTQHSLPACLLPHALQHVKGRIFNDPSLPGLPPAQRAAVYQVGLAMR